MLLSDELLLNYKRCERRAFLDIYGDDTQQDPEREFLHKLRQEHQKHISQILAQQGLYQRPEAPWHDLQKRATQTQILMEQGVECIYGGVLWQNTEESLELLLAQTSGQSINFNWQDINLISKPSLLVKQPGDSNFGNWHYSPIDIKLGRRPKPEYKLVAAFHSYLLAAIQGTLPTSPELILREQKKHHVHLDIWLPRLQEIISHLLEMFHLQTEPEVFISRQRCNLCRWYTHCHNLAQQQAHLSLVPGITPRRYMQLQTLGLTTLESLATTNIEQINEEVGVEITAQIKQQAQSILENRALPKPSLSRSQILPTAPIELYFDIEAEPERNLDYLLGVLLVNRHTNSEKFYSFFANKPEDESLIWSEFLSFVESYPQAPIFHYSEYEVETMRRLANTYQTPQPRVAKIISRLIDLHKYVITSVTLPVHSYSLKSLANWIGFQWRDGGITGDQCICWYDQWLKDGNQESLAAILRYNEDDCRATRILKDWLVQFIASVTEE